MQTQHHTRSKSAYHPALAPAKTASAKALVPARTPVRAQPAQFRVVKPHESFRLNQVVYLYNGPKYDIDVPGEVDVTVVPGVGPFVGLTPEHLERIG